MPTLDLDKVSPATSAALQLGDSGDTITVPSGVTLTATQATVSLPATITASTEIKTNKISPGSGTAFTFGDSGDTFNIPSGVGNYIEVIEDGPSSSNPYTGTKAYIYMASFPKL